MDISVVIPVKNEQDNVAVLAGEVLSALKSLSNSLSLSSEIVFVDDGSTDTTVEKLKALKHEHPDTLRIVQHRHNCGQSAALYSGVRYANGRWIITLDGDGQNDPADIPGLVERMQQEQGDNPAILVTGYRKNRKDTWIRRLSSRIANGVRSTILQDHTPDTGCGLKMISRDDYLKLPFFDHMHRFLPALVIRQGGKVVSVDVNHRPRLRGKSKYGINNRLWVGIVDLFGMMWLIRRGKRPVVSEIE
ncbi:MAG: glycosyltransferase [Gammaproteobacteria bacterium]|jgi:dolichol-phosphate mannosyltransferase